MSKDTASQSQAVPSELEIMAKWIKMNPSNLPDHACAECVPDGDLVKPGFQCGYHIALAVLVGKSLFSHSAATGKVPEEWKFVPVELTDEMRKAWTTNGNDTSDHVEGCKIAYRAMIAASPAAPLAGKAEELNLINKLRQLCNGGAFDLTDSPKSFIETVRDLLTAPLAAAVPAEEASEDEILAAAQKRMWEALDRRACPGPWMQIASDAIFDFKKDSYGAALASPAAPLAGKAEPCSACHGSGWVTRDADIGTDQECFVCEGSGKVSDLGTAPLAAAVPAEEASECDSAHAEKGFPCCCAKNQAPAEPAPIQSSTDRIEQLESVVRCSVDDLERIHLALGLPADDPIDAEVMIEHIARLSKPTAQGAAEPVAELYEILQHVAKELDECSFSQSLVSEDGKQVWRYIGNGQLVADRVKAAVKDYRHIAAQATAGRDAQQWISVDERLPEDGDEVAVVLSNGEVKKADAEEDFAFGKSLGIYFNVDGNQLNPLNLIRVEYWAPLPLKSHAAEQASGGANADAAR